MISFLREKNFISVLILCYIATITLVDTAGTLSGDKIIFSPLRKGSNYTLEKAKRDWFLASFDGIAEAVVLSLNSSPPYGAIKDGIRILEGKANFTAGYITREAIAENLPLTLLTSLSVVSAFLIPLVGIIFGCFRCKGKCGGELIEEDLETNPKKHRQLLTAAISVCSALIMIAAFSISLVNDKTEKAVPALDSLLINSIVDVIIYKENTLKELSEVTGENMNFTIGMITKELSYLPVNITTPVIERSKDAVDELLHDIRQLGPKLTELKDSLKEVSDTVQNLRTLGQKLRAGLDEARNNLTEAKADCNNDPPSVSAGACDKIPAGDDLQAEADFTKVPDAAQELSNIQGILSKYDFEAQSTEGESKFNSIAAKVYETTISGSEEITNFTKELQDFTAKMVDSIRKAGDTFQTDVLLPMKNDVHIIFGKGGLFNRYDKYRWMALLSISLAIVFVVLLTFLSLISGALGSSPSDTPSTRSDTSNCAGRALMCVAALYFFSAFFLNLILALTFFLGANATVLCKSAADLSLLENTIDDPSTLGYYPVSKAVLGNEFVEIRLSDLLRRCSEKETPWKLLRLDSKFNFENMTSYKDKIPPMDEILSRLNSTLLNITLVTNDTKKAVNDIFKSGVQEIEFFKYSTEAAKPLLKNSLSLPTIAKDLETAASDQVSDGVAEKLRSTKDGLNKLQDDSINASKVLVVKLSEKSQLLMAKNMNVMNDANKVDLSRIKFRNILEGDGLILANEAGKRSLGRALGWMDQYLEDAIDKLRNEVGNCHPIRSVYDVLISDVCANAVGLVNSVWLCLGVIAMFSVITIILCVRLAKHLRRAKTGSENVISDEGTSNYGVPLRLFDKFPKVDKKKFTVPWKRSRSSPHSSSSSSSSSSPSPEGSETKTWTTSKYKLIRCLPFDFGVGLIELEKGVMITKQRPQVIQRIPLAVTNNVVVPIVHDI
ncbi:prominin-2-like [Porites lutea]|uniref:prominin-2-like n=1 Tax=Porites lutea TaxID=51062 RepID=UPI003CC5BFC5